MLDPVTGTQLASSAVELFSW